MHKQLTEYIAARLGACSIDELRVIDYVLAGIEQGRTDYGPLDLSRGDGRDWLLERAQECRDLLFYTAVHAVAEQRRSMHPATVGLAELRTNAPLDADRCSCGHERTDHVVNGRECFVRGCHCPTFWKAGR